jgi:hypothetical protein
MKHLTSKLSSIKAIPEHQEIQKQLDYANKKKQQQRDKKNRQIDAENLVLYNRLTRCQPTYKYNDWVSEHDVRERYLNRIARQPLILHHNPTKERTRQNLLATSRGEINPLKEFR